MFFRFFGNFGWILFVFFIVFGNLVGCVVFKIIIGVLLFLYFLVICILIVVCGLSR